MKSITKRLIDAAAVTALFAATVASAQAMPPVPATGAPQGGVALPAEAAAPAPRLGVSYMGAPSLTPGGRNIVGAIVLDASLSSSPIAVPAIPLAAVFTGMPPGTLHNCVLAPTDALDTPLTSGPNMVEILGPVNTFTFDRPIAIPAGKAGQLALECVVNPAPPGSSISIAVTPQQILAYDVQTGGQIIPTVILTADGSPASFTAVSVIGDVQTAPPGIPNTGAGGDAVKNILALTFTGALALVGALYLLTQRKRA